jgi:hypothetical protein
MIKKIMSLSITNIYFKNGIILLHLSNGSSLQDDLNKFPKLFNATQDELNKYELWDNGKWIHWGNLNEDLGLEGFLRSGL